MTDPLYTTKQVADALGIGRKLGRDWVFSDDDLATLRARNTTPGPSRES